MPVPGGIRAFSASSASASTAASSFSSMQSVLQLASISSLSADASRSALSGSTARRPRRQFVCRHCSVAFKRGEHLARHERSHTAERPFVCTVCERGFTRKDLLVRHQRMCDGTRKRRKERRRSIIQRIIVRPEECEEDTSDAVRPELNPVEAPGLLVDHQQQLPSWSDDMFTQLLDFTSDVLPKPEATEAKSPSPPASVQPQQAPTSHTDLGDWSFFDQFAIPDTLPSESTQPDMIAILTPVPQDCSTSAETYDVSTNAPLLPELDSPYYSQFLSLPTLPATTPPPASNRPQQQQSTRVPSVSFDNECRQAMSRLLADLTTSRDYALFDAQTIRRYITLYVVSFSHHFPIVHNSVFQFSVLRNYLATADQYSTKQSEPTYPWEAVSISVLVIVMAAVGAVHCHAHRDARVLRSWARKLFDALPSEATLPDDRRLALVQARLILSGFDAWSGDDTCMQLALDEQAFFARYCHGGLRKRRDRDSRSWKHWVTRESCHRIYWGIFILMSDYNITFHQMLPLRMHDTCVLLPDSEALWLASNEKEWRALVADCPVPASIQDVAITILGTDGENSIVKDSDNDSCEIRSDVYSRRRDSSASNRSDISLSSSTNTPVPDSPFSNMTSLTSLDEDDNNNDASSPSAHPATDMSPNKDPNVLSLFSVFVTVHVVMNHIWSADKVLHIGRNSTTPRLHELNRLRAFALQQAERLLMQNEAALTMRRTMSGEHMAPLPGAYDAVTCSMIFNACSLVRVMQIRLFKSSSALNSLLCDPESASNTDEALEEFLNVMPEMSVPAVEKALEEAVIGLEVQARAVKNGASGKRLSPAYWGIEHALCGWDSSEF
ncbi:uncharacterized protein V1518DRAFT_73439 [Limtongia smithiae]|uniref:uncharacterized protein n=1 Tax=Limtongia smithiae TaxID=1125753 RepID=UPI0034CD5761